MKLLVNDARGQRSITLTLTLIPFVLVNLKFLIGGMIFPAIGEQPSISVVEYASALSIILAPFLIREGVEKNAAAKVQAEAVAAKAKVKAEAV